MKQHVPLLIVSFKLILLFLHSVSAQTNKITPEQIESNLKIFQILKDENLLNLETLFLNVSSEVSPLCTQSLNDAVAGIIVKKLWPLQMLDAWGKIPEGILVGHWASIGDFDECLALRGSSLDEFNHTTDFKGRYCPMHLLISEFEFEGIGPLALGSDPKNAKSQSSFNEEPLYNSFLETSLMLSYPTFGICLPSSCSRADFNLIFAPLSELSNGTINPLTGYCYTDDKPDLDPPVVGMIGLLLVIALLALVATGSDLMLRYFSKKNPIKTPPHLNKGTKLLLAFSLYTNIKKWSSTDTSEGNLGCLHGLRFLSMCWVVLGHTWAVLSYGPIWNPLTVYAELHKSWTIITIIHGSFSVDTFFTIAGFLLAFQLLKALDKSGGKFNPIMILIHRYLRITPTYAILIGIVATLPPFFSTGPMWAMVDMGAKYCRRNGWQNLLYINNLIVYDPMKVPTNAMCFGESWYLAVDMQLFLITPTLVFLVWKWKRVGLAILTLVTIGSVVTPGVITSEHDLIPTNIATRDVTAYQAEVYLKPWTRAGSHLTGIWAGYFLHLARKKSFRFPRHTAKLGWILSTGSALAVLYGITDWFDPSVEIPRVAGIIYAGLHRFVWGVVIAWIIFACVTGHGGLVNRILSMKIFMPLGRLSFCVYLASYELQTMFHARFKHPISYDPFLMVNLFFSHLVLSLLVGFILTIFLESPFVQLEKLILGGGQNSVNKTIPAPIIAKQCIADADNASGNPDHVTIDAFSAGSTTNLIYTKSV